MVVANNYDFGEIDPHSDENPKSILPGTNSCTDIFSQCDNRGMLPLNQDLIIHKGNIEELYRIDKGAPFATGLYAQVKRCKSLANNTYYAAKFCPRKRPGQSNDEECIENLHEIALLSQLKHPYVISFIDAFILEDCVVTIMELAPGGDLQTIIDADLVLLEKDATRFIFQLLEALKYLHERHIAHLDIKPQNLLLMGEFPTCDIKLCDFEISRVILPDKEVKEILGTPDYVAPEILLYEPLSTAADMWSVGILCYVLLTGFSPFGGDTDQETFRNIVHQPIDFPEELFDDISPDAIDFIEKLTVKNAKLRPSVNEIEKHEWLKSVVPVPEEEKPSIPVFVAESQPTEPIEICPDENLQSPPTPKKRHPRKAMALAGLSTASAAGRRPSARSILRACKSAYDLNKLGGKTKSREALIEKMKMASGDPSVGGNWKLRKNLSKSREQLWESKIQLSKSCEKINNNLPGSTRWASVANFPSLDLGAMKSSTSQESVVSTVSNCTNVGSNNATVQDLLEWQQQSLDDFGYSSIHQNSLCIPTSPPVPNFDLSAPVNNLNMQMNGNVEPPPIGMNCLSPTNGEVNYPSLVNGNAIEEVPGDEESAQSAVDLENQKSVAELIMTFGGKVGANAKKLDLKNQFEPILEVDGAEEQPVSIGDYSDNLNQTSVNSMIMINSNSKEPRSVESGIFSMNSASSMEPESMKSRDFSDIKRRPRTSQQMKDELRATRNNNNPIIIRRTIAPISKSHENPSNQNSNLKGILKKPAAESNTNCNGIHYLSPNHQVPPNVSHLRRGSIPGNSTRLYDTHTISSLAKVPKKSILKNSQANNNNNKGLYQNDNNSLANRKASGERSCSKSPDSLVTANNGGVSHNNNNSQPDPSRMGFKKKVIPKGFSPREQPSFILLNDVNEKPRAKKPTTSSGTSKAASPSTPRKNPTPVTNRNKPTKPRNNVPPPPPRAPPKPRPSIREQILMRKKLANDNKTGDKSPTVTVHIVQKKPHPSSSDPSTNNKRTPTPPSTPTSENPPNKPFSNGKHAQTYKSELNIEPAAVAIKIFPPDPVIIPKSCTVVKDTIVKTLDVVKDSKNVSQNNDNTNNRNNNRNSKSSNFKEKNMLDSLVVSNNRMNMALVSPEMRRRGKHDSGKVRNFDKHGKPTWGVVCTGSIGRAMERFESGTIKGKKLRRGSVPDF